MKHHKLFSALLTCAMLSSVTALPAFADEAVPSEAGEAVLYGDVNLDANISLNDAVLLNKAAADTVTLSEAALKNADCNADGDVDLDDSIILLRFLVHLTDSLPDTGYTQQQNPQVKSKISAIGYSDALLRLANSENSSAVITSCDELRAYLSPITVEQNVNAVLKEYNDAYFAENVLLVNAIYQSCGGGIMYTIDDVSFADGTIQVNYSDLYENKPYITIVSGLLGEVTVPKSLYHGQTVSWVCNADIQCEMEWSITGLSWVWDGFEDTIGKEYVITSQAELEDYFDTIAPKDAEDGVAEECESEKSAWLTKYDDSFFRKNLLLIKPTSSGTMRLDDIAYEGNVLNINTYDEYYNQTEPQPDTGIFRHLEQVVVPKSLYFEGVTIRWNEAEITWSVNPLNGYPEAYYPENMDAFLQKDYVFTSYAEFKSFIDSLWPTTDVATPYTEALQSCLDTYSEEYFTKNVLLLKPFLSWRDFDIQSVQYTGDNLLIRQGCNAYEVNDGIDQPYFGLVNVPKCLWHAEEVAWSNNEIQTAVDWLPQSDRLTAKMDQDDIMEYVIESTSELTAYFDSIYGEEYDDTPDNMYEEARDSYLETYDDAFFEENVLLLKNVASTSSYRIQSTYFVTSAESCELWIDYAYDPYGGGCLMGVYLLQVAVPRTIYNADTVIWNSAVYGEGDEFSWTVKEMENGCGTDFMESTKQDYIFYSTKQLAEYFDAMDHNAYEPVKQELLAEYNDAYFEDNILLMKPVFWYSPYTVESIGYGDFDDTYTLSINCTYAPHDENVVCLEEPSLTLVTVPRTLWRSETIWHPGTTVSWNCMEMEDVQKPQECSYAVEEINYSGDLYTTTENEYLFTSSKELEDYFDTIYQNIYTNSPDDPCAAIKASYLEKYNDAYFEKNFLLMKPIEQGCGEGVLHTIDSVVIQNGIVKIDYTDHSFGHPEDVVTDMLALVTVPKSLWSGDASEVQWIYHNGSEITWSVEALGCSGSGFDASTEKEYVITSTADLAAYFDSIYENDYTDSPDDMRTAVKESYLKRYNDDYFAQNVLLMKPILQNYGGQILYNIFDVFYYDDTTLNIYYNTGYSSGELTCVFTPLLAMVTIPKLQYHAENVNWIRDMDYIIDESQYNM